MILPLVRSRPQVLVIVQADRPHLIAGLVTRFSRAILVVDRRRGDRRQRRLPRPVLERRAGRDRRRALYEPEALLWREAGYRIVYRTGGAGGAPPAAAKPETPSTPKTDPMCPVCHQSIPRGSPLVVRESAFCHWACAE